MNIVEFVKGEQKVLVSKDLLPLTGAVLGSLAAKEGGATRFGVLKNRRVFAVLAASKVTNEAKQVEEISKVFKTLEGKGIIALSGDKVQSAQIVSEYADLAKEVMEMAEKIELPEVKAKAGRPAGSTNDGVKRNPTVVKRFYLSSGTVTPFGRGKPTKDKLLAECDENGKNIANVESITARFAAQEEKRMSVKRNPVQKANLRYYMVNGTVTPFGRGKPGIEKLSNECSQAGEPIDNSAIVAVMRQPKSGGGNSSKVSALEAQITQMQEMMAKMMAAMAVGAVALPAAAEVPVKAEEKPVEAPKPPKAEKPKKSKGSKSDKPATDTADRDVGCSSEEDAYEGFASVSGDLGDDGAIAFDSNGFVVTDID